MNRHYRLLVGGSIVFLLLYHLRTSTIVLETTAPGGAAAANSIQILYAMQLLGAYAVFVALVLGHGLLGRPTDGNDNQEQDDPDA